MKCYQSKSIYLFLILMLFVAKNSLAQSTDSMFQPAAFSKSTILYRGNVNGITLDSENSSLVLAMDDSVEVISLPSGKAKFKGQYGPSLKLESAGFSKDGETVIGGFGHDVYFWSAATNSGKPTLLRYNEITGKQAGGGRVDFVLGPNRNYAASSAAAAPEAARLVLWDLQKQEMAQSFAVMPQNSDQKRENGGDAIAFNPDGKRLAVALQPENEVWIYDIAEAKVAKKIELDKKTSMILDIAFSPDGKYLATTGMQFDAQRRPHALPIELWEAESGQHLKSLDNSAFNTALEWSPDGNYLASGTLQGAITFWNISEGKQVHQLKGEEQYITDLVFSSDGQRLFFSSRAQKSGSSGSVRMWSQK